MNHTETAKEIIQIIGADNVTYLTHCATRLRFNIKDISNVNLEQLDRVEGVIKSQYKNGQLQVIIGAKVGGVFEAMQKLISLNEDVIVQKTETKQNVISQVIETISGVFGPVIPVLIGCGMIKSVTAVLTTFSLISTESSTFAIFSMIGDLLFYFFPFFLAVSSAKKFKTNEFLAIALAGALMYPTIQNGALQAAETGVNSLYFMGLPILLVNYKSTIIPIILSVWIMSYVYRFVNKLIPDTFKVLFVPMLVLFIMVPLELIAIGPFGSYIGQGVAQFVTWLYNVNGVLGAFLFGTFRPLLIILGMHYAITPINTQLIAEYGFSVISPANLTGNLAQAGATLAVFFLLKNKTEKSAALTSGITALFGVTEPAMFGFNLKYKNPMLCAMLGGGIGAAYMNFFGGGATAIILPGVLALPTYIADSYIHVLIAVAISIAFAFIGTLALGIKQADKVEPKNDTEQHASKRVAMTQPIPGTVIPLSEVKDSVFSTGMLGEGYAIEPTEGKVCAPFDGSVIMLFETKHAIGLRNDDGAEVLIHIGLDTVELHGEGFETFVQEGDRIAVGDVLVKFDKEFIQSKGYQLTTPVIVTNTTEFSSLDFTIDEKPLALQVGVAK
jgi:PTS system beta-glucosides-specific IIC component